MIKGLVLAFEYFFYGDTAVLSDSGWRAHFAEGCDGGLHEVVGVRRSFALGEDVSDAYAFEDGTHSATGFNTGTVACGLEDDARAAELSFLLVGDGAFVDGDADKVLLGSFNAFCDGCSDFVSFAEAPTNDAVFVANDNDSCEGECAATLGHLGDAVDGYETVLKLEVAGGFYSVISFCHDSN